MEDQIAGREAAPPAPPANEGKTPAAWTLVIGVVLGAAIVGVGIVMSSLWTVFAGTIVIAAGLIAGVAMRAVGFGQADGVARRD